MNRRAFVRGSLTGVAGLSGLAGGVRRGIGAMLASYSECEFFFDVRRSGVAHTIKASASLRLASEPVRLLTRVIAKIASQFCDEAAKVQV